MSRAKEWQLKARTPGAPMELTEHLDELRDRIIWCLSALFLSIFVVGVPLAGPVLSVLERPFRTVGRMTDRHVVTLDYRADGTLRASEASRQVLDKALVADADKAAEALASLHPSRVVIRGPEGGEWSWGLDPEHSLFFFTPLEPVTIYMKIILLVGVVAALPIILWNVWRFISPGLTDGERHFTRRSLQAALLLFPTGMFFAWFLMTYAIYFLMQYASGYVPAIGVGSYINLTLMAMLLMGVVFEFPLVLLMLMRIDLVRRASLERHRPHVLVGLLIASGILTPPDPFTMVMVGAPLYLLFEITLLIARTFDIGSEPGGGTKGAAKGWWHQEPADQPPDDQPPDDEPHLIETTAVEVPPASPAGKPAEEERPL